MSKQFTINPKLDFAIERFIDAPTRLVWEALTKPEHLKEWYMPKAWGRVSRTEMDVRPGGIFSIDIAMGDGQESPNLGCFLEVIPMERLVWTSMLSPAIVRLSLTTFRSPPSLRWKPWEQALATSSRRCTGMKRTSRKTKRRAFSRAPRSPSISSWST
jgi:uncharacterized protein YndB with AHSA1/START domain